MTNDILQPVDFPTKEGALYLYKGKYKVCGREEEGITVIRTFKCAEGYFSYMSIRAGGFEYHSEKEQRLIGPQFFGGVWFEINEGD